MSKQSGSFYKLIIVVVAFDFVLLFLITFIGFHFYVLKARIFLRKVANARQNWRDKNWSIFDINYYNC